MPVVTIIEDDARIRQALAAALEARGHLVRSASDGMSGLRQVIDDPPEVVVLDLGLPDINGLELLAYLAANQGQVVSKRQLLADLWRQPYGGADKTIDVHLSWLRRKLGESSTDPRYIRTVRGVGVRLASPDA